MPTRIRKWFFIIAAGIGSWSNAAAGGISVSSQLGDGLTKKAANAGAGSWTGLAYSERTTTDGGANPANPNGSTRLFQFPTANGADQTLQSPVPLATTPNGNNVVLNFGTMTYGPAVGADRAKNALVAPFTAQTLESTSGGQANRVMSQASYYLKFPFLAGNAPAVSANASADHVDVGGKAAAISYDPITVGPGVYQYGGENMAINFNIALGGAGDLGQIKYEAFDSRYVGGGLSGDNIIFGDPLWSLLITSDGTALSDKSNISADFTLNPEAVAENTLYVSTVNGPQAIDIPSFEAGIESSVLQTLTVSQGVASLSDFDLFSPNLMYQVSGGSVTYASDTGVGMVHVSSVPEPSGAVLLGIATLGFAVYRGAKNWYPARRGIAHHATTGSACLSLLAKAAG